jgi:hypothetical protein
MTALRQRMIEDLQLPGLAPMLQLVSRQKILLESLFHYFSGLCLLVVQFIHILL